MIRFVIHALAQPAGSKRGFARRRADGSTFVQVVDANPKAGEWKRLAGDAARRAYAGPLLQGALTVSFTFVVPRPKGHFGKRGLLPSAPAYPTVKPDVLKLARGLEDALTGILWRDDAQTVALRVYKEYGEFAQVRIEVELLAEAAPRERFASPP